MKKFYLMSLALPGNLLLGLVSRTHHSTIALGKTRNRITLFIKQFHLQLTFTLYIGIDKEIGREPKTVTVLLHRSTTSWVWHAMRPWRLSWSTNDCNNLLIYLIESTSPFKKLPIRPKTGGMGRINNIDSNDTSRYYPPTTIAMTCDITSFYQTFYLLLIYCILHLMSLPYFNRLLLIMVVCYHLYRW